MDKFLTKYNAELIKAIFKEIEKGNKKTKNVTALVLQLKRNNKIIYIDMSK